MRRFLLLVICCAINSLAGQEKWDVKIYYETANREVTIYADNNEPMQMSVHFDFTLNNLTSTLANGENVVLPAKTKKIFLAKLIPVDRRAANQFSYISSYNFGDVKQSDYQRDYLYDLPFEKGKTYTVFQGYNGTFTHQNENSLDFSLKAGDQVLATRNGVVMEAVAQYNKGCANMSCAKFNNRILIMHDDGTVADYSHLQQNGTVVKKGDHVQKGQVIGYSGNTGFSSGPHLHFGVFINRMDGKRDFVKTLFNTTKGPQFLMERKSYKKPN